MKIGKVLILAISISCLLIGSVYSVVAADEEETIDDPQGDVLVVGADMESVVTTDEKSNIDIKKIMYSKTDGSKEVTLAIEVYGEIEDRGGMEISLEMVYYAIQLTTSSGLSGFSYEISYINQTCQVSYPDYTTVNITDFSIDGGILTVPFDLLSTDETYEDMVASTAEIDNLLGIYMDMAPDEPMAIYVDGPYDGEVGDDIEFSGSIVFPGIEPYTYQWDFGDGETSTEENPVHSYEAAGNYTVTLTVTDDAGSTANDTTLAHITKGDAPPSNGGADSGLILFVAVIAIIAIIGIIVIIFIVRR